MAAQRRQSIAAATQAQRARDGGFSHVCSGRTLGIGVRTAIHTCLHRRMYAGTVRQGWWAVAFASAVAYAFAHPCSASSPLPCFLVYHMLRTACSTAATAAAAAAAAALCCCVFMPYAEHYTTKQGKHEPSSNTSWRQSTNVVTVYVCVAMLSTILQGRQPGRPPANAQRCQSSPRQALLLCVLNGVHAAMPSNT
eukprot:1161060-Pelagomonas_calceolata.AAC.17